MRRPRVTWSSRRSRSSRGGRARAQDRSTLGSTDTRHGRSAKPTRSSFVIRRTRSSPPRTFRSKPTSCSIPARRCSRAVRRCCSFVSRTVAASRSCTSPALPTGSAAGGSRTTPLLSPEAGSIASAWGFEDPRLVHCPELGGWVITCTAFGPGGPCVYLATTSDFVTLDHQGVVMPPEDKNAAVFPHRIDGYWCLLHRPVVMASGSAEIWLSRSEDLESWRSPERVMTCRPGGWWDHARIGIGPPPIETPEGWLLSYHGVRQTMSGALYRVGVALLDLHDPVRLRARADHWMLSPTAPVRAFGRRAQRGVPVRRRRGRRHACASTTAPPTPASAWRLRRCPTCSTCCSTQSHPRAREPHRRAEGSPGTWHSRLRTVRLGKRRRRNGRRYISGRGKRLRWERIRRRRSRNRLRLHGRRLDVGVARVRNAHTRTSGRTSACVDSTTWVGKNAGEQREATDHEQDPAECALGVEV